MKQEPKNAVLSISTIIQKFKNIGKSSRLRYLFE